jgi:broad specificity phosphatase PhoE
MGELVLVRHGETEWSANGRHTSFTEKELTPRGEQQARDLVGRLREHSFTTVLTSPRVRATATARLAGLTPAEETDDLAEWHYGEYEGVTTKEIHKTRPAWSLWTDGAPGGETPEQIGARIDRLLARVTPLLEHGDVALVAHGHSLRVVGARWIGLPVAGGGLLALNTATVSVLDVEHGRHVIRHWNSL